MKEVRMEHTAGLGAEADVWVDGNLLTVCDHVSTAVRKCPPGIVEDVEFRYMSAAGMNWIDAVAENRSKRQTLEHVKNWSYVGFGRVLEVSPVVIHFGIVTMEDPNWCSDDEMVGQFVRVQIDRLEMHPAREDDTPV